MRPLESRFGAKRGTAWFLQKIKRNRRIAMRFEKRSLSVKDLSHDKSQLVGREWLLDKVDAGL